MAVLGVGGGGTLGGVVSITGDGYGGSYCALLTSDGADCWGYGFFGGLGDGSSADEQRRPVTGFLDEGQKRT